jgi:peptidoglycan hydrolase-like protein with peptidoglycan-binding domain
MRTQIDLKNEDEVIWLQRVLSRLSPYVIVRIGVLDPLTEKALRQHQRKHALPVTGRADEVTLQHIQQQLEKRGLTIS